MTEIAWAAGFYDGEGCTRLVRKRESSHVRMAITQKDRRVLDRFLSAVGEGVVYIRTAAAVPYSWQTTSEPASRRVFDLLKPWLSEMKTQQAEAKFAASTWHGGSRGDFEKLHAGHGPSRRREHGARRCLKCQGEYNAKYAAS